MKNEKELNDEFEALKADLSSVPPASSQLQTMRALMQQVTQAASGFKDLSRFLGILKQMDNLARDYEVGLMLRVVDRELIKQAIDKNLADPSKLQECDMKDKQVSDTFSRGLASLMAQMRVIIAQGSPQGPAVQAAQPPAQLAEQSVAQSAAQKPFTPAASAAAQTSVAAKEAASTTTAANKTTSTAASGATSDNTADTPAAPGGPAPDSPSSLKAK